MALTWSNFTDMLSSSFTSYPLKSPSSTSLPNTVFTWSALMANGRQMVFHSPAVMVRFTLTSTFVAATGAVVNSSSSTVRVSAGSPMVMLNSTSLNVLSCSLAVVKVNSVSVALSTSPVFADSPA